MHLRCTLQIRMCIAIHEHHFKLLSLLLSGAFHKLGKLHIDPACVAVRSLGYWFQIIFTTAIACYTVITKKMWGKKTFRNFQTIYKSMVSNWDYERGRSRAQKEVTTTNERTQQDLTRSLLRAASNETKRDASRAKTACHYCTLRYVSQLHHNNWWRVIVIVMLCYVGGNQTCRYWGAGTEQYTRKLQSRAECDSCYN